MKICIKFFVSRDESEFALKDSSTGLRHNTGKQCHCEYAKKNYRENRARYLAKTSRLNRQYRKRNIEYVTEYLLAHPCVDCGERDIEVLEFDHIEMIGERGRRIGRFMNSSIGKLVAEISKCAVRCANCHTRRTRQQMGWFRKDCMEDEGKGPRPRSVKAI
jgi:hypothetical protein